MNKKTIILELGFLMIIYVSTVVGVAAAQNETLFNTTEVPQWLQNFPLIGGYLAGLGLLACCFFIVIPLIIAVLLCIWIYKDAEKRGKEGLLWVILMILAALFLNILGIILVVVFWLAVRPPLPQS